MQCGKQSKRLLANGKCMRCSMNIYKCSKCGAEYKWTHDLVLCKKCKDAGTKYICTICGKELPTHMGLASHMKWHDQAFKEHMHAKQTDPAMNKIKKAKLSKALRGHATSEETKVKIREAHKRRNEMIKLAEKHLEEWSKQ